jgi:hypothetical protein
MANNMTVEVDRTRGVAWVKDDSRFVASFTADHYGGIDRAEAAARRLAEGGKAPSDERAAAIRECVTWLAMNHADWKPEALAGEMARALLEDQS